MANEVQKYAVAVNLGSEPKIREAFETARKELVAQTDTDIIDNKGRVIARWKEESGWKLYPKKPRKGPAIFVAPFRIRVKATKTFAFPREGNEEFVVRFQTRKRT